MAEIDANSVQGALDLADAIAKAGESVGREVARGVRRAVMIVHRESVKNAPVSPTNAQYSKAVLKRKKRTARKMHPGGLSRSIEWDAIGDYGTVYVASNSEAAKYAKVIHDERYKRWKNRGPGTIAKGSRAREKFIERALADNEQKIGKLLEKAIEKGIADASK